jgi:hypothetical protein
LSRLQAYPVELAVLGATEHPLETTVAGLPWSSVLTLDFIRAVDQGEETATKLALDLLNPVKALSPNRYQIYSRPVLL